MISFTKGSFRRRIELDEAVQLDRAGSLIRDDRRRRPFYFDGRFLTARDLTREQDYFLARQADLGRATGSGVINGLFVSFDNSSVITIRPGHGITSSGEIVTVASLLRINLADIAESQDLDARFGVSASPRPSARQRSGVFILAIRPVEYTANPVAAYPQTLTGNRSVEDGEIVEAAAVTLIPFAEDSNPAERSNQQSRIARDIFLRRDPLQASQNALPIAMLSLSRGVINWLDVHLVRREVGADHGDSLGFGFAPRALREAQFIQYRQHLSSILTRRAQTNQSLRFPASEHFFVLPPAGPLPAAAVDTNSFTQSYFPPSIPVEMSVIPEDELRALVEDALLLPPIDLSLRDQEMATSSVLILAAVPRDKFQQIEAGLDAGANLQPSQPVIPKLLAGRRPFEILNTLTLRNQALPLELRQLSSDERWRKAVALIQGRASAEGAPLLWYVRRRNFTQKPELAGAGIRPVGNDESIERNLTQLATNLQTRLRGQAPQLPGFVDPLARWNAFRRAPNLTIAALATATDALSSPKYAARPLAFLLAMSLFERDGLNEANARRVAVSIGSPRFGNGVDRLQAITSAPNITGIPLALLEGFLRGLVAESRLVEFDQLLDNSDNNRLTLALQRLIPNGAALAPNFSVLINAWLTARVIS